MNKVKRACLVRKGPPTTYLYSRRVAEDYINASPYNLGHIKNLVAAGLFSSFFTYECGICHETFPIRENPAKILYLMTEYKHDWCPSNRDLRVEGFIICNECEPLYRREHSGRVFTELPLENLLINFLEEKR